MPLHDAAQYVFLDECGVTTDILRRYGNMSSAAVMFVIDNLLRSGAPGRAGCAMSFGPGLIAETMLFRAAA